MRAAIYSRFSTDRQNESSIADQVRVCTEHAERQGWQVVELTDLGISGAATGNRPGLLRMLSDADARRFEILLLMDVSRLRETRAISKLAERLVFGETRVVAVHDGADTGREGWEMQFGMAGIVGQQFRLMTSKKTYAAHVSRAKEGRAVGGKCYGYRNGAVYEPEAQVIRWMYERFAAGRVAGRSPATSMHGVCLPRVLVGNALSVVAAAGWVQRYARSCAMSGLPAWSHWNRSQWVKHPESGIGSAASVHARTGSSPRREAAYRFGGAFELRPAANGACGPGRALGHNARRTTLFAIRAPALRGVWRALRHHKPARVRLLVLSRRRRLW